MSWSDNACRELWTEPKWVDVARCLGLLNNLSAFEDETFVSYLMRLAAANYLAPGDLGRHYTEKLGTVGSSNATYDVSTCRWTFAISTTAVERARTVQTPRRAAPLTLQATHRICTKCIGENKIAYLRHQWNVRCALTCSVHHTMLRSRCPKCQRSVALPRGRVHHCACGFAYADAEVAHPPSWLRQVMSVYGAPLLLDRFHSESKAAADSLAALAEASRTLNLHSTNFDSEHSGDDFIGPEIALLERWFTDWPYGARRNLAVLKKTLDVDGRHCLWRKLQMDTFPRLRIAFDEDHYDEFEPVGATSYRVLPGRHDLMTRSELAARCGVPFHELRTLLFDRRETSGSAYLEKGELKIAYYRDWGMQFVHDFHSTDSVEQASHMTGFTVLAIDFLSAEHVVNAFSMGRGSGKYRVSGPQLCALLDRIGLVAKRTLGEPRSDVWLSNAVVLCAVFQCARRLMEALQSGQLAIYLAPGQTAFASNLWMNAADLAKLLESWKAGGDVPERFDILSWINSQTGVRSLDDFTENEVRTRYALYSPAMRSLRK